MQGHCRQEMPLENSLVATVNPLFSGGKRAAG
jgi:hypothetical protein